MTYRPEASVSFGPPISERLPTILYFAFAMIATAFIIYGQHAPTNTWIFRFVVEGDRARLITSSSCAIILSVSAIAAMLREQMRGVVVHPEGLELRELLAFGLPRVRKMQWSQIDRFCLPAAKSQQGETSVPKLSGGIGIDLWDGTRTWLPAVGNGVGLALLLERVALARAIPVEGGTGLLDDIGNPREH
jgi:hypothetical protein